MQEPAYQPRALRLKETLDSLLNADVRSESKFLGATMAAIGGIYVAYVSLLQYVIH